MYMTLILRVNILAPILRLLGPPSIVSLLTPIISPDFMSVINRAIVFVLIVSKSEDTAKSSLPAIIFRTAFSGRYNNLVLFLVGGGIAEIAAVGDVSCGCWDSAIMAAFPRDLTK